MTITRRDFMQASAALAVALGLRRLGRWEAVAAEGAPSVVWLQAQGCSGCSVSLLNSIEHGTIDGLLTSTLDLNYHPTLMAAAGDQAVAAAREAWRAKQYVLVVEGAVPTGSSGQYCYLWPGMTALAGVRGFAQNAAFVLAVGTCAAYGGVAGGKPNPTGAKGVRSVVTGKTVINIPGCPVHPDWLVGTIAYLLRYGKAPRLDKLGRPLTYFGRKLHDQCPYVGEFDRHYRRRLSHGKGASCFTCHEQRDDDVRGPDLLSEAGCLYALGCKGPVTYCDCPTRGWNAGAAGARGVNWCVEAKSPCLGCTEAGFPDAMSPFFTLSGPGVDDEDDDHEDDDHRTVKAGSSSRTRDREDD